MKFWSKEEEKIKKGINMIVGLENLKEDIRQKQLRDLALSIVKYQNFKTSAAIKNIKFVASQNTTKNYFGCGVSYIKSGGKVKHKAIPSKIYDYIDEYLAQHVQPLTPSESDRRGEYKQRKNRYHGKSAVPPVAKLDIVRQPLTEKYDDYGIKSPDGYVKICKSRDYAEGYMEALKDNGKVVDEYKIIAIKISEV